MQFDFLVLSYPLPKALDSFPEWKDTSMQFPKTSPPAIGDKGESTPPLLPHLISFSREMPTPSPTSIISRVIFSDTLTGAFCLVVPHTGNI